MRYMLCGILLLALTGASPAEPALVEVAPPATGPTIRQARGPHRALVDPAIPSNGLLLLSLGGTHSLPADFDAFDRLAAALGFHVVALDYPNSVISTAARDSRQPDAFRRFRQEIVGGDPVSDLVEVDAANSIEGRFTALLASLAKKDATWSPYLEDGRPVWGKVVVVGHSQGSGHAAFLGKRHRLKGVLMLAGPQDTDASGEPVAWLEERGLTDPDRFLGILHRQDPFHCDRQLRALKALRGSTGCVEGQDVIVLDTASQSPHMAPIGKACQKWWRQLLDRVSK